MGCNMDQLPVPEMYYVLATQDPQVADYLPGNCEIVDRVGRCAIVAVPPDVHSSRPRNQAEWVRDRLASGLQTRAPEIFDSLQAARTHAALPYV
jgi:hypothetical protein